MIVQSNNVAIAQRPLSVERVNTSDICTLIALQSPYFGLYDLERCDDGAVAARFDIEHDPGLERGPVSAGELYRHLAILGSCAAALASPSEPKYYLASKGKLNALLSGRRDIGQKSVFVRSEIISHTRKDLTTRSVATVGDYLASFYCEYQILTEPVFARTFRHNRMPLEDGGRNSPYRKPIELQYEQPQSRSLVSRSVPPAPSQFAGHFPRFPSWPASIYAEAVSRTAGMLLQHICDRPVDFDVARFDGDAYRLVPATDPVSFHVDCTSASKHLSHYTFRAEVKSRNDTVAAFELEAYV